MCIFLFLVLPSSLAFLPLALHPHLHPRSPSPPSLLLILLLLLFPSSFPFSSFFFSFFLIMNIFFVLLPFLVFVSGPLPLPLSLLHHLHLPRSYSLLSCRF